MVTFSFSADLTMTLAKWTEIGSRSDEAGMGVYKTYVDENGRTMEDYFPNDK